MHVTLVDHDDTEKIVANAQANNLTCKEYKLNPLRVPGDLVDKQGEQEVHYCQVNAKAVMMMESYNFMLVHHCPIMLLIIFYTVVFGPPPSVLVKNRNMCVTRVVSVLLFCTLLFQIEQELYQNLCVVLYCFILNKSCVSASVPYTCFRLNSSCVTVSVPCTCFRLNKSSVSASVPY